MFFVIFFAWGYIRVLMQMPDTIILVHRKWLSITQMMMMMVMSRILSMAFYGVGNQLPRLDTLTKMMTATGVKMMVKQSRRDPIIPSFPLHLLCCCCYCFFLFLKDSEKICMIQWPCLSLSTLSLPLC